MKIVSLDQLNLMDIPGCLHRLADNLESNVSHAIIILENNQGDLQVFGYGEVGNRAQEVGTLNMAALQMAIGCNTKD